MDATQSAEQQLGFRDAIHVPYVVVACDTALEPGCKVSLRHNGDDSDVSRCVKWGGKPETGLYGRGDVEPMWHGVADPFLESTIPANSPFRCFIRKECFTKLRHDFLIEVYDRGGSNTCHSVCGIF